MDDIVLGREQGRLWSESSITRSLYISRRKLMAFRENDKPRKVYECPIVGCDFLTSAPGMIDVHVSEKHRAADDPSASDLTHFVVTVQFLFLMPYHAICFLCCL